MVDAALRLGIQRKAILVSSNKLLLSMMYGVASYKGCILGMFTLQAGKLLLVFAKTMSGL
jgi:hypothetical protein